MGIASDYLILGVDGGGTGCRVALCKPDGQRLAEAAGGPANFSTDAGAAIRNILSAVREAAATTTLTSRALERCVAHIGLAGVMDSVDRDSVLAAMPLGHVSVSDDRATSVAGALGDCDGFLAAIGTGTIVAARKGDTTRYFGGWGHHLADQASGGRLGRKALRRAMLVYDGLLQRSDFTEAVLKRFNGNPLEAMKFAEAAQPGDFASLAPLVIESAHHGDPNALSLMHQGAAYLHSCFEAAGFDENSTICLAGGVGPHYEPYLEPKFRPRIRPSAGTALDGAVRIAQKAAKKLEREP